ncbi:protein of unknown function [Vibrio tapetis subsp. tapetis]|uniref:Uncharacterized protein n=1 Tax=Vibrio tapetis subsp. tapetis TaxID=1671868 RepID=A0A2N8ZN73_9VIBR|nr:protein of unknown function [Vibrio tapetis subsp. tapetis]
MILCILMLIALSFIVFELSNRIEANLYIIGYSSQSYLAQSTIVIRLSLQPAFSSAG